MDEVTKGEVLRETRRAPRTEPWEAPPLEVGPEDQQRLVRWSEPKKVRCPVSHAKGRMDLPSHMLPRRTEEMEVISDLEEDSSGRVVGLIENKE